MIYGLTVIGLLCFLGMIASGFKAMDSRRVAKFLWSMIFILFFIGINLSTIAISEIVRQDVNGCDFLHDYEQRQNDYCKTPVLYFLNLK